MKKNVLECLQLRINVTWIEFFNFTLAVLVSKSEESANKTQLQRVDNNQGFLT